MVARSDPAAQIGETRLGHIHVGLFDLDGVVRHKLVDAVKAVKLPAQGYSFRGIIHPWDGGNRTWHSTASIADLPARIFADLSRDWLVGPAAGVAAVVQWASAGDAGICVVTEPLQEERARTGRRP